MRKRICTFGSIVLTHEQDNRNRVHRLHAACGPSPWRSFDQQISYDVGGRYFIAILKPGWPECFEVLVPAEAILTNIVPNEVGVREVRRSGNESGRVHPVDL